MHAVTVLFLRGGVIMWPLLLCSILSVTVTIERLLFWWRRSRSRSAAEPLLAEAQSLIAGGEVDDARHLLGELADPAAELLAAGLAGGDPSSAMEKRAVVLMRGCRRGLRVLETIIAVAPMLGLLGTVFGIIQSFGFLGAAGGAAQLNVRGMAGGIAEALITTAFGLPIAILSIIPYNYLSARVQREAEELSAIATSMEEALHHEDRVRARG